MGQSCSQPKKLCGDRESTQHEVDRRRCERRTSARLLQTAHHGCGGHASREDPGKAASMCYKAQEEFCDLWVTDFSALKRVWPEVVIIFIRMHSSRSLCVCCRAYLPIWEQKEFHSHPISLIFCIPRKPKGISPNAGNSCWLESTLIIVQGLVTVRV